MTGAAAAINALANGTAQVAEMASNSPTTVAFSGSQLAKVGDMASAARKTKAKK